MQEYYSSLWIPRLVDALHERPPAEPETAALFAYDHVAHWNSLVPGWRELAVFLKDVDGVVVVVDSQRERIVAGIERLEHFTSNLRDCGGRDPAQIAIVFQLNKRDLPSAANIAALKESFRWPGPVAYVESVATKRKGIRQSLDALLDLLGNYRRQATR